MTSTSSNQGDSGGSSEEPSSLADLRLPLDHAARLFAVADGLCAIGQLRTGERGGQFSIFNFLMRCALDQEYEPPNARPTHVLLMQAGVIRRHAWYAYFWLPDDSQPLRVAAPAAISKSWHWHDDLVEISKRLDRSETWREAVGAGVDAHIARFAELLDDAEIVRARAS